MTLTLSGPTAPLLLAGQGYWLELAPPNNASFNTWQQALNTQANRAGTSHDGSQTFSDSGIAEAFRINATPAVVPEPGAWALLTLGGVALALLRQARGAGARH